MITKSSFEGTKIFDKSSVWLSRCADPHRRTKTVRMREIRSPLVPLSSTDWVTVVLLVGFTEWKWEQDWNKAGNPTEKGLAKGRPLGHVNWTDDSTKSWKAWEGWGWRFGGALSEIRGKARGKMWTKPWLQRGSEKARISAEDWGIFEREMTQKKSDQLIASREEAICV